MMAACQYTEADIDAAALPRPEVVCPPSTRTRVDDFHWYLLAVVSVFADLRSLLDSGELADMRLTCHEEGPGIAVHRYGLVHARSLTHPFQGRS